MGWSSIQRRALAAMLALSTIFVPLASRADRAGSLAASELDESQYGDFLFSLDAYKPLGNPRSRIRPFVDLIINEDSKETSATIPWVYGDSYAGASFGFQFRNTSGLRVFLQGGATTKLGAIASVPSGGDIRGGAQLYRDWGGLGRGRRSYGSFYGSGIYYSRYQDTIFYDQMEIGRAYGSIARPVEVYLRGTYTLDTHQYYYYNAAELVGGIRLHPLGVRAPAIAFDLIAGTYTHPGLLPTGTSKTYWDFRPVIVYSAAF